MDDWWFQAFPLVPYQKAPPGTREMLTLVAYDISDAKRLHRVARVCEDFGVRVQYSLFECRLEEPEFRQFWDRLVDEPFDGGLQPLFYFPTQPVQKLVARDEKTYLAREARIELAEVPFVPLRVRFPDIATVPTRFRTLVQKYVETFRRDASKPALVALHENPPRVVVDGAVVGLEGQRQLTVIRFLLRANQEKWLGFDPDEELRIEQQEAVEFFKASHGYEPDPSRVRPVFRDMLIRHYKNSKPIPGSEWISGATTEDIKRPLSYWRTALDRTGSTWVPKSRELRFPAFRLVEAS